VKARELETENLLHVSLFSYHGIASTLPQPVCNKTSFSRSGKDAEF